MKAAGETRDILVVVPENYDPSTPHRLVFAFHGRTTPAARARAYYDLEDTMAGDAPTLFVYPTAARQDDGTFVWRTEEDSLLFDAVVDRLADAYCLDRTQVFAVGHSLGASFVNTLGCLRGNALRGVASVAGGIQPGECQGNVAALLLHNRKDRLVPFALGEAARDRLLATNGLHPEPDASFTRPYACDRYGATTATNPVAWCQYTQSRSRTGRFYPHLWPDGAEQAMADFFRVLK